MNEILNVLRGLGADKLLFALLSAVISRLIVKKTGKGKGFLPFVLGAAAGLAEAWLANVLTASQGAVDNALATGGAAMVIDGIIAAFCGKKGTSDLSAKLVELLASCLGEGKIDEIGKIFAADEEEAVRAMKEILLSEIGGLGDEEGEILARAVLSIIGKKDEPKE